LSGPRAPRRLTALPSAGTRADATACKSGQLHRRASAGAVSRLANLRCRPCRVGTPALRVSRYFCSRRLEHLRPRWASVLWSSIAGRSDYATEASAFPERYSRVAALCPWRVLQPVQNLMPSDGLRHRPRRVAPCSASVAFLEAGVTCLVYAPNASRHHVVCSRTPLKFG
jgi:hypothetical protein